MRIPNIRAYAVAGRLAFSSAAFAREAEEGSSAPRLTYRTGDVELPNKVASLHLGSRFRHLDPAGTEKLLVGWGNPPGSDTQGAIIAGKLDLFAKLPGKKKDQTI